MKVKVRVHEDKTEEEKPEITQSAVMAKLQRVNNTMKEKDAEIRSLKEKNESLAKDNKEIKDKMNSYDTVVNDLTAKNSVLTSENEKLTAKNESLEKNYTGRIEELEDQVAELTKSKKEDSEASRNAFVELKEQYNREIESLKKSQAEEIKRINDASEKRIQAIYSTISEALGDSYDDRERTM